MYADDKQILHEVSHTNNKSTEGTINFKLNELS